MAFKGYTCQKYHVRVTDNPMLLYRLATKWLMKKTLQNIPVREIL